MRSKRILGVVSAIMMLGVCAVPAYADSEAEIPEYSADKRSLQQILQHRPCRLI